MQEIYSMILNTSITTVITVIFLWQYITNIKKDNENKDKNKEIEKENSEYLKQIKENTHIIAEYLQRHSKKK